MIRRPEGLPAGLAALERTAVMGVLNVTPDSFSDGGAYLAPPAAVEHGIRLFEEGADLVDVGGESTRPGAHRVPAAEECHRVLPVVRGLVDAGVPVSIDTMCAATAAAAVATGACLVNDVSGGLADPEMYTAVAGLGVPYIAMHWRGLTHRMQDLAAYGDVVVDVRDELDQRVRAAMAAGIAPERIVVDPGLGFAKETSHNWSLLSHLDSLDELGLPILIGASRKRFLGALLTDDAGQPRPVGERDAATDAVTAIAATRGVWAVRVHDVRGSKDAVRVAAAWIEGAVRVADQILIRGISGIGHHGVFAHEREQGQPFSVDVRLDLDTTAAAGSDDLDDTVDYGQVANAVHALIVGEPVDLIETLAERIADACLQWPAVSRVRVTVHKPQAPIEVPFDDVEVRITRRRHA